MLGKLLIALGAAVFIALLATAPKEARSASGYEELVKSTKLEDLHKAAIKHGGFEKQCMAKRGGCQIPQVLITNLPENVDGQFDWRAPTVISVSAALQPGTLRFNETIVHEYVHQLQFVFGEYGPQKESCMDMIGIETKAYKAGAAYLDEFGIKIDYADHIAGLTLGMMMCAAEGG